MHISLAKTSRWGVPLAQDINTHAPACTHTHTERERERERERQRQRERERDIEREREMRACLSDVNKMSKQYIMFLWKSNQTMYRCCSGPCTSTPTPIPHVNTLWLPYHHRSTCYLKASLHCATWMTRWVGVREGGGGLVGVVHFTRSIPSKHMLQSTCVCVYGCFHVTFFVHVCVLVCCWTGTRVRLRRTTHSIPMALLMASQVRALFCINIY
jgi:hypothetical protein